VILAVPNKGSGRTAGLDIDASVISWDGEDRLARRRSHPQ
jgi:hypothetical protein